MRVAGRAAGGGRFELGIGEGRWAAESGGDVLDLLDLWCLPGLADAHSHLAQDQLVLEPGDPEAIVGRAWACLEGGVFLCFDKGWSDRSVLSLSDLPPSERPDLQAAGLMLAAPGGYYPGFGREVGEEELVTAVVEEAEAALGWVKVVGDWPRKGQGAVANFGEEALTRAVEAAHRAGARVAIHTMAPEVPSTAVRAGVDSIEHGLFLTEADLHALGRRNGAWVPTLLRMEALVMQLGVDSSGGRLIREGLGRVRDLLPTAAALGVAVLAGSDLAVPPWQIGREAVKLMEYGLDAHDAVAATSSAARLYAGEESGFAIGLPADLVAFHRSPFEDPHVLTQPVVVLRRGRLLVDRR